MDKHQLTSPPREPKGLLPSGLSDLLAPQAEQSARAVESVLACLGQYGYQRIKPPLLEFEQTLLDEGPGLDKGPGAVLADQTFRLLDPISRQMMALRSDMTAQIARISGTRLARHPRPLRLAYGGEVMRVVPDVLNPERQMIQAGAEIIGVDTRPFITEIIMTGIEALTNLGLKNIVIDLSLPDLCAVMMGDALSTMDDDLKTECFTALGDRDTARLKTLPIKSASAMAEILTASGRDPARVKSIRPSLPPRAGARLDELLAIADDLTQLCPDARLTLDPLDMQNFGYHTSFSFALYGEGLRGALARGGSYRTGYDEPAVGLSIYMERVLRGMAHAEPPQRIYIPAHLGHEIGRVFIRRGRHILYGSAGVDAEAEARAQNCDFILHSLDGAPEPL